MDCKSQSSDHYNDADESNTKRAKTSIIDVAWKALVNLDESIKDIKGWENERSILKRKIYNQNEKINHLAANNGSLTFEIKNLKSQLDKTMEKSLTNKIEEFCKADKNIDEFIVNSAVKVICTIESLSNNLVSVHHTLNVYKDQNKCLQVNNDKLKCMIRISSGNNQDYRDRVNEFRNLIFRMNEETYMLKNTTENINADCGLKFYKEKTKNIALLMEKLKIKLKNDRRALFAGGNPYWSVYLDKIGKLVWSSENLVQQLAMTKARFYAKSCGMKWSHAPNYHEDVNQLEQLVKRVQSDLNRLKTEPMLIGLKIGGESCIQYFRRIGILEELAATTRSIINKLIIDPKENVEEKRAAELGRVFAKSKSKIEQLLVLAKKFKSTIEELGIAVATVEGTESIQKIRELDNFVKRLSCKLADKDEENESLRLELTGAKIAFGEKVEELENLKIKHEKIINKMKNRGCMIVDDDQQISSLASQLERTKIEAGETQKLKDELNKLRVHVANFSVKRETLLEEINQDRAIVKPNKSQILHVDKKKKIIEKTQIKNKNETEKKLIIAEQEIKCLQEEIVDLKEEIKSNQIEINASEATKVELNHLETLLKETNERLVSTSKKCEYLKSNCNEIMCEKTKIDSELLRMKIQNEALIDHLNSEKTTTAETLKHCHKLMSDHQLQERELERLKTEKSSLETNVYNIEREKNAMINKVNELRDGNEILRDQLSSLKSNFHELTKQLEESNCQRTEIERQNKILNEENKKQRIHSNSIVKENDRLNNELDNARSEKLNMAGSLNEWRLRYEDTKNLLEVKIQEAKFLDHHLKRALQDNEKIKVSEAETKVKITESLETSIELRETIDILNSDKTKLEQQLTRLSKECQTLESRLSLLQSDNEALQSDSSSSKQRVDKLSEQVTKLVGEMEENARNRVMFDVEHRETTEIHQRKFNDFEIEHNTLKDELLRLRAENSSLKSDADRISVEHEKIRSMSLKKDEFSRLTVENERLKFELANLRNSNSKADREIELAKNEREKLCQELCRVYAENCTLKLLLEKIKTAHEATTEDSRQMTLRFNELKTVNDQLHKSLEEALKDIANRDVNKNEMDGQLTILQNSIDELEQRHGLSKAEIEELRSRNENLAKEMSNRNKENSALMEEVNALRSVIKTVKDNNVEMKTELAQLEEELEALKVELAKTRAEISLLHAQFETKQRESCKFKSENVALKEMLEKLQRSKILGTEEEKQLRIYNEKLQLHNVTLESKLIDAQKEIGKYTIASSKLNCLADKLKSVLEYYAIMKPHYVNQEIDHLYLTTDSYINNNNFKENIEAT